MPMVPSVAMKGSMPPTVVMIPFSRPQAAPTTSASMTAAMSISTGSAIIPLFMNKIMMLATKATIAPTDKSSPPDEIT
ncbi:Hypothetical protein BMNI_I0552 [Brucella melitensis NI]|nr:Hypothetical protein BMNI_I0552 [Brucella melitensis NI]